MSTERQEHHASGDREDAGAGLVRIGPGVPPPGAPSALAAGVWHGTVATGPPRHRRRWRRRRVLRELRRYTLAASVLLAVLGYLLWQRLGPDLAVEAVSVSVTPGRPGCGATADVVGVVRTNGGAGRLTYQWVRSDGGRSRVLEQLLPKDRREARLHLRWTFQGEGTLEAAAELRVLTPTRHAAAARISYRCP